MAISGTAALPLRGVSEDPVAFSPHGPERMAKYGGYFVAKRPRLE
jgi:hypothetical protein